MKENAIATPVVTMRVQGAAVPPAIDRWLLVQIAICIIPAMTLLRLGFYTVGARCQYTLFFIALFETLLERNPAKVTSLVLGCMPALMLLRDFIRYNSVQILLAVAVCSWYFFEPTEWKRIFRSPLAKGLIAFSVVYWLLSFFITGDYNSNLRIFELTGSALGVFLLGRNRGHLATALSGVVITGFSMGLAMLGQGERLGMIRNEEGRFGNPVSFGLPMALIILLCLADEGRWLLLAKRALLRWSINVSAGIFVLLSTSRGSWSVVASGVACMLLLSRRRMRILGAILLVTAVLGAWVRFADPESVTKYFDKTFHSEEEWSNLNARVAQWEAFPAAFAYSPLWGFGPGLGRSVSTEYSGHNLIWHSIYLHFGIECGSIGLLLLATFLALLIRGSIIHLRRHGEVLPLVGIVGFIAIGFSVPAIDGVSGLFLGLSLLGTELSGLVAFRIISTASADSRQLAVGN